MFYTHLSKEEEKESTQITISHCFINFSLLHVNLSLNPSAIWNYWLTIFPQQKHSFSLMKCNRISAHTLHSQAEQSKQNAISHKCFLFLTADTNTGFAERNCPTVNRQQQRHAKDYKYRSLAHSSNFTLMHQ